jgi:hypothetical protein
MAMDRLSGRGGRTRAGGIVRMLFRGDTAARMFGVFLILALGVFAPSVGALANPTRIGLHGGLSIPSIQGGTNEVSEGYTSRLGPYFGLFTDFEVRPGFSVRGEINYASQGGQRNGMQPITPDPSLGLPPDMLLYAAFDNETILDYIEIPIMAKLTWGETLRFWIDGGPYVGFLVRAKTVTSGSSMLYVDASGTPLTMPPDNQPLPPVDFSGETDIKQDVNSTNAGIAGGLGLEFTYGPGDIVFEAHFSVGLTNIQKDVELNGENRTGALAVIVGYAYPLGGSR